MGLYINPPTKAEEAGRKIELPEKYAGLSELLQEDEVACVVAWRHGRSYKVALVIDGERDFIAAQRTPADDLVGYYAVPKSVADSATG